ncbi:MAG: hypothetical protein WAW92_02795 [Minisyncoccia bacterium]
MAEEKKPDAPWAPATGGKIFSEVLGMFLLILLIGTALNILVGFFSFGNDAVGLNSSLPWYERFTEKGKLVAKTIPLSALENPIGMRVVSMGDNDVYDSPGGRKLGSHKLGDAGRVIQGPVEVNGVRYWYVDYDTPPDGWVREDQVRSLTQPISSVEDPIGKSVMNTVSSAVYDENGNKIGDHKAGDRGKILRGPIFINGERYWYVDYEEGVDGWVSESDIGITKGDSLSDKIASFLLTLYKNLKYILFALCILCFFLIAYLWTKIDSIRKVEKKLYYPDVVIAEATKGNTQWERILDLSDSLNENDWRLAIIEADIMLADLLDKMQLPGDTIGEKMKMIEKSDFTTIDNAWEAHKTRNAIAHQGNNFALTQREARRIISLYQSVFEEFQMI